MKVTDMIPEPYWLFGDEKEEKTELLAETVLSCVYGCFSRRPERSLVLIIDYPRLFMSVDGERLEALEGFGEECMVNALKVRGFQLFPRGYPVHIFINADA